MVGENQPGLDYRALPGYLPEKLGQDRTRQRLP